MMQHNPNRAPRVVWEFQRDQVEQQDFSEFLDQFGQLPEGDLLKDSIGTFTLGVGGYDDDPREIQEIPEVRAFFKKFSEVWPYWLFFIEADNLRMLALCVLKTYVGLRDGKVEHVRHVIEDTEMLEFIHKQTPSFMNLCHRAGMDNAEANALLHRVSKDLVPPGPAE